MVFLRLFVFLCVCFPLGSTENQSTTKQIKKIEQNIQTLNKDLQSLKMTLQKNKGKDSTAGTSHRPFYALAVGDFFKNKQNHLIQDWNLLRSGKIFQKIPEDFLWYFLGTFLFGYGLVLGVWRVLARKLWQNWSPRLLQRPVSWMVSALISVFLVPVLFYSLMDNLTNAMLDPIETFYLNIPFFIYIFWASYHAWNWAMSHPSIQYLAPLRRRWMVMVVTYIGTYGVFLWGIETDFAPGSGLSTLLDICATIFFSVSLLFLHKLRQALHQDTTIQIIPISLKMLQVFLGISYILLLTHPYIFHMILTPFIVGLMCLPLSLPLRRLLRKVRVHEYRIYKRKKGRIVLWDLLKSKKRVHRLSWMVVGTAYGVWALNFWQFRLEIWAQIVVQSRLFHQICDSFLLILGAYSIVRSGDRILRYYLEKKNFPHIADNDVMVSRLKTLLTIARTFLRTGIWLPTIFLVLSTFGYDITPLVTSLGVLSLGMSLGVQSFVKDFVAGFFMILENTLVVGDSVNIDNRIGVVEGLSLRTVRIRLDNGALSTIPFGSIQVVGNLSRVFSCAVLNVSVPYDQDEDLIHTLLNQAEKDLRQEKHVGKKYFPPIEVRGINDVTEYSMVFQVRIKAAPGQQEIVRRAYIKVLKRLLDAHKIRIPSPSAPTGSGSKPGVSLTSA